MNLDCLNSIILENLAIHIDLSDSNSWNLNTGYTSLSLTKWEDAISSDLSLLDFGLTGYDNAFLNSMLSGFTLTAIDNKFTLYRVGANDASGNTSYSGYTISTGSSVGNYFSLDGGFLQGFHKLEGYDYEILPPRYNQGITIETVIQINPDSQGIFFFMGTRAEDKYNPYFSGETAITDTTTLSNPTGGTDYQYSFSGITTSEGNYLEAYVDEEVLRSSFAVVEDSRTDINIEYPQIDNIKANVMAFELTSNKKLAYKYLDLNGDLQYNESPNAISRTGWSTLAITFTPDEEIRDYDSTMYQCYERRTGTLRFYVNGRLFWTVEDFTEWYSRPIINDKEKQLGVPFTISWGGGSFGLENSWHFNTGSTTMPYVQDSEKADLTIEEYFNSTYIGGIQKLRVYTNALTSDEILHNTLIEKQNNSGYSIVTNKGGRIIYRSTSQSLADIPTFSSFNIAISSPFEVGEVKSGSTLFTWATTASANVATSSIGVYEVSGSVLGLGLVNDGTESLDIGTLTNTGQTTYTWGISGYSTQGAAFVDTTSVCSTYPIYYGTLTGATRPPVTNNLVTGGTKSVVNSNGTVCVDFNSAVDEYTWLAIPSTSTSKTCWYIDTIDNGTINDSPSDKYPDECVISISSAQSCWSNVNYKVYMSGFFGEVDETMEFRNS